jgi:carbonic anhydrase
MSSQPSLTSPSPASFPPRLLEGYRSFLAGRFARERERYEQQAAEQTPETMIIGCCDSRVSPEVIFDAGPGELFVSRNVANLVPPFSPDGGLHGASAALEYAVQALKVKHIVVLGHARCGGIRAFADPSFGQLSPGDFIGQWIRLLEPAARAKGSPDDAERQSLENLRTFPCVNILEGRGKITLHGSYFDVATGILMRLNPKSGAFEAVVREVPERVSLIRAVRA